MPKGIREGLEILLMADLALESEKQILTIQEFIRTRLASGMSKEQIREILQRDLIQGGQLFGDFRKNVKSIQRNASEDFARAPLIEGRDENFDWVGIGDSKICDDCLERNNMPPKPFGEWAAIGLPGEGATACNKNCRCILLPVGSLEKGKGIIRREQ